FYIYQLLNLFNLINRCKKDNQQKLPYLNVDQLVYKFYNTSVYAGIEKKMPNVNHNAFRFCGRYKFV
ncbi:MAG: hypothetical protein WCO98_14080, partial [bacterium]